MRTPLVTVAGVLVLSLLSGCTVKDVDPPSLAGPSTLARAITMTANKDTLFQNGVDFVDILVTSTSPTGQQQSIPLRAEIRVGGVAQDFGTLSTKLPVTPTTLRYTAPNASPLSAGQVAQLVTIVVMPIDSGDFRSEVARQLDLRLLPQGVVLPTNPNLAAAFTVTPASPQAFSTASFDASTTTNGTTACNNACSYAWNFGDGTTGAGITTTHEYRTVGTYQATLTVTDSRGAQATTVRTIAVSAATPPTVSFTTSPANPGTNQTIFFNASASRAATGRKIVSYDWDFGKGTSGTGVTTTKSYETPGSYTVTLKVTDDAGAFATATQTITVGSPGSNPTAVLTASPSAPTTATNVFFDASASRPASTPITQYRFTWGDGTPDTVGTSATTTHRFTTAGGYTVRLTVTDSEGRQGTTVVTVTVM